MASREANRLTALKVKSAGPGKHADGAGLWLVVDAGERGARRWVFRYTRGGARREMGLASARDVPLAEARNRAAEARRLLAAGGDPLEARREAGRAANLASKEVVTFGVMSDEVIGAMRSGWRNSKHRDQWLMSLARIRDEGGNLRDEGYALALRDVPVADISTENVLQVLRPIWTKTPESARRLRGRIETVLDAATAAGHRKGENVARWRGHLKHLLGKQPEAQHHAAMPYDRVPALMERLRTAEGVGALALRFVILTAGRSGEIRGATWSEIDLDRKLWTVPAARMKGHRTHVVPLSAEALAILSAVETLRRPIDDLVFPGMKVGAPLSDMSLSAVLRRLGEKDTTVHGFRSAFRDWCGDATSFPRDVAEAALAHAVRDKVEAAYRRGSALAKRP